MHSFINIALTLIALYCFGMWGYFAFRAYRARDTITNEQRHDIADFTFRVGLCGILCLGFLLIRN